MERKTVNHVERLVLYITNRGTESPRHNEQDKMEEEIKKCSDDPR